MFAILECKIIYLVRDNQHFDSNPRSYYKYLNINILTILESKIIHKVKETNMLAPLESNDYYTY